MRHLLALALATFLPLALLAFSTTDKVRNSVVRISMLKDDGEQHSCTGFVVAPMIILTANHCDGNPITFDGIPAVSKIKGDNYYDLAVYRAAILAKPPVKFRDTPVIYGEPVTAIGFGYGWDIALVLPQTVVIPSYAVDDNAPVGIIVQGGYVGGMSGGPVFDKNGEVVGIVQRAVEKTGYGVGTQFIKAFLHDANVKGF